MNNKILIIILILFLMLVFILLKKKKVESFEVAIASDDKEVIKKVNLGDFFKFLEYFQTSDMSTNAKNSPVSCYSHGESILISNNIRNLLYMLHFIINVNHQDNFYSRFLVSKVSPNLKYNQSINFRRFNYDEIVRNRIGKQFTFLPSNEYDKYYPKGSVESEFQYPLPETINVHNYYTYTNTDVNLLALKMLLDLIQENDPNVFEIYSPTEYTAFNKEFLIPLRSIKNSMVRIVDTQIYRDYIIKQRFDGKYRKFISDEKLILNYF